MEALHTPFISGLDSLLSPGSLALVGATEREGSIGRTLMENILRGGFHGRLHPVNPGRSSVLGNKAYASVLDIPGEVDAAVVAVSAERAEGVLLECARKGVRGVAVISSGFEECGPAGRVLEASLGRTARTRRLALMGPNCLGLINTDPRISLNATIAMRAPRPGSLSLISQGGALGAYALEFAAAHDIGLRLFASVGNGTLLHENHLLRAFGADPLTKAILAYLEDFRNPEEFFDLAAAIASGPDPKPIVILMAGTGSALRRATASRGQSFAGKPEFLGDLCAQSGMVRASCLGELFDHALCLSRQPLPRGPRVAIVSDAGGTPILAIDEAERLGLSLEESGASLRPPHARNRSPSMAAGSPIESPGGTDSASHARSVSARLESGEADAVLSVCAPRRMADRAAAARALAGLASRAGAAGVPLLSALAEFEVPSATAKILDEAGIPNYPLAENAVRALAAAWRHGAWRRRSRTWPARIDTHGDTVMAVLNGAFGDRRGFLVESEWAAILKAYGIGMPRSRLIASHQELRKAAWELGFPLVAKLESPDLPQKAEVGAVMTGIGDVNLLERAYTALLTRAGALKPGGIRVNGILLQERVPDGVEFLIAAHRDPRYGLVMAFGLGGALAGVIGDRAYRRAPLTLEDADGMIHQIRAEAGLQGIRGRPPRDLQALRDCLLRLSWLMADFPLISDAELNPVFSLESGALVADARMALGQSDDSPQAGTHQAA